LDFHLFMQSVVSSASGEVYSIQNNVIKFVIVLRQHKTQSCDNIDR
jgi:hypothetical protein